MSRGVLLLLLLGLVLATPARAGLFGSEEYERAAPPGIERQIDLLTHAGDDALAPAQAAAPSLVALLDGLRGRPIDRQLAEINRAVNQHRYVSDLDNYAVPDHWATLAEFEARSGDCEDYAIAKYMLLKALGVAPQQMRIAVVQDLVTRQSHAVLSVEVAATRYILDNQAATVLPDTAIDRYRPIYSVNEQGWWLHMPAD